VTTNLEQGDIDSVCKCFFSYICQVAAAFGVDPQSRTGLIFIFNFCVCPSVYLDLDSDVVDCALYRCSMYVLLVLSRVCLTLYISVHLSV